MKREYIKRVFEDLNKLKQEGIWFSGVEKEGEYKTWHNHNKLFTHCFYKKGKLDGEYKAWSPNGKLLQHCFYKKGEKEGEYKVWDSSGKLTFHSLYRKNFVIKDYLK